MTNEDNECAPTEIQHWPVWAMTLREDFAKEAFKLEQPWDAISPNAIKRAANSATAYVLALYPGLEEQ